MTTVNTTLILNNLYETAKDYAFFRTTNQKGKTAKLKRKLALIKSECNQLGVSYDLTKILK